jgi:hypothetical protein
MAQSTIETLIQVAGIAITFITGFVSWLLNEHSKRLGEEYQQKEERYVELVKALRGFYADSADQALRESFLQQLNLCWLYCPDEVIQKAYSFLRMVQPDQKQSDAEKEKAMGELILAIRKDLLTRKPVRSTALKPEDFKHFRATESGG